MALEIDTSNGNPRYKINNWQEGIADSPELGFSDMRNMEIGSIQGEIMPTFKSVAITQVSRQTISYTVSVANPGVFTTSSNHQLVANAPIKFLNVGGTLPSGISSTGAYNGGTSYNVGDTMEANGQIWYAIQAGSGHTYTNINYWREAVFYVSNAAVSNNQTFTISRFISGAEIQVTGAGTGTNTFSTVDMGIPKHIKSNYESSLFITTFIQDSNGLIWFRGNNGGIFTVVQGNYSNHLSTSTGNGNGLVIFTGSDGNTWLFACNAARADVLNVTSFFANYPTTAPVWVNNSTNFGFTNAGFNVNAVHKGIFSIVDQRVYFTDENIITYFAETTVFDPTNAATFTPFTAAVNLRKGHYGISIEELGDNILVGDANSNMIYVWNKKDSFITTSWRCAENIITEMLNVNNTVYILAGTKGVIYSTQGYSIDMFKKIPEYLTGGAVTWGGLAKVNGHLLVGLSDAPYSGSATHAGVYKIFLHTLEKGTLTCDNTISTGSLSGLPTCILGIESDTYFMGSTGLVDIVQPSNYRYTDGSSFVETQILSVSDVQESRNFELIGLELGRTLSTGESIVISSRETPKESYAQLASFDFVTVGGIVNDYQTASITDLNAILLKVVLKSNTSTLIQSPRLKTVILK